MIEHIIMKSFAVYAVTFVIASSSLFERFRGKFIKLFPMLKIGNNKHFIECRMCTGFWVALCICIFTPEMILPVYGFSYFLATQER